MDLITDPVLWFVASVGLVFGAGVRLGIWLARRRLRRQRVKAGQDRRMVAAEPDVQTRPDQRADDGRGG